jgi:hypothetical protein
VNPEAHVGTQAPDEQVWPAGHTVPQVPQFLGSVDVLVQIGEGAPGQLVLGDRHWQMDAEQTSAGTQALLHVPQLAPFVALSTHVPEVKAPGGQIVTVVGVELHAHAARWQVPSPQEWPQLPQFPASVWRSAQ